MIYLLTLLCFILAGAYFYLWGQFTDLKDDMKLLQESKEVKTNKVSKNYISKQEFTDLDNFLTKQQAKLYDEFNKASAEQWQFLKREADLIPETIGRYVSDALDEADFELDKYNDRINKALRDSGYAKDVVNKCISKKTREKHGILEEAISKEMTEEQKKKIQEHLDESGRRYAEAARKKDIVKMHTTDNEDITMEVPAVEFPKDPTDETTEIASFFNRETANTDQFDLDKFMAEVNQNAENIKKEIENDL